MNYQQTTAVLGTILADNAAAGIVGEYQSAQLLASAATPLTSNVPKTIISIALTPGDWDVTGVVGFIPRDFIKIDIQIAAISLVNNTLPAQDDGARADQSATPHVPIQQIGARLFVGPRRVSIASITTVYLIGAATYATIGSPLIAADFTGYGRIFARRMR